MHVVQGNAGRSLQQAQQAGSFSVPPLDRTPLSRAESCDIQAQTHLELDLEKGLKVLPLWHPGHSIMQACLESDLVCLPFSLTAGGWFWLRQCSAV